jgi:hypothetical protein
MYNSSNLTDERNQTKQLKRTQPRKSTKLNAQHLITIKSSFSGYCLKKSPSWLNYCFPFWFPIFKKRFLISCGNFIFRYVDEYSETPKGVPIPIDGSEIVYNNGNTFFEIFNLHKQYFVQLETLDECMKWVHHLRRRKLETIRENLGHRIIEEEVKRVNKSGYDIFNKHIALNQEYDTQQQTVLTESIYNPISLFIQPTRRSDD